MSATIDKLGQDHQHVLAQLSAVEHRLAETADAPAEFAAYLDREVLEHFAVEEEALFPILARHLPPAGGPLAVMNAEHEEFRSLLAALRAAVRAGDAEQGRGCARELIELLRGHIAKEDRILFPMAMQMLSGDEQREVDARAAQQGGGAGRRA